MSSTNMSTPPTTRLMAVLLNGIAQLEYDRAKPLPDYQGAYLDKMDSKMDEQGIDIDGRLIRKPDLGQKAQFVAANLVHAIKSNQEPRPRPCAPGLRCACRT